MDSEQRRLVPRRPPDPAMRRALVASGLLRSLHGPLIEDAEREVRLALRVAVLLERRVGLEQIAARLAVSRGQVLQAKGRVQRARERADSG